MAARTTPASDETDADAVDATDLTQFQTDILTILAEEARYGLAIKRALEDYYGEDVNHGRLYPNLDTLVEDDLVAKSELDKRTNQYELTDPGRAVITARLEWIGAHLDDGDEHRLANAEPATAPDGATDEDGEPVLVEGSDE